MRWTMQPTRATTRSQHASRVIAALQLILITFVMHAMVGRLSSQLKMPRPDAYDRLTIVSIKQIGGKRLAVPS